MHQHIEVTNNCCLAVLAFHSIRIGKIDEYVDGRMIYNHPSIHNNSKYVAFDDTNTLPVDDITISLHSVLLDDR